MLTTVSKISLGLILLLLTTKCSNYEFPTSPFPAIETLPVTIASPTQVTFTGNLSRLTDKPIIDHGFVWGFSKNVVIGAADQGVQRLGSISTIGKFQGDIVTGLQNDTTYYVKAFVVTADSYKVYGAPLSFRK